MLGARPVLEAAPTVPWVGAPHILWGGVPHSSARVLFVLTEAHFCPLLASHVWGWCRRGSVGFAPTRHPSYVLCAQMPTLSQWDKAYFWVTTSWAAAIYKTPCYVFKLRSMFLPCVFAGSGVSATPRRLWPAAPWTGTVQGQKKGKHLMCGVKKEQQARHAIAISPRPQRGRGPFHTTRSP